VNARGGLKLKSGQAKIKLIEYDDRTQPPEAIKRALRPFRPILLLHKVPVLCLGKLR
jgi:hypothetical protein